MFEIIGSVISSFLWGLFLSVLTVGLLYFVPKGFNARYDYSLSGVLALCLGFLFFLFQYILMVGAMKSKGYVNKAESYIQAGIQSYASNEMEINVNEITDMIDSLCDEYSFLEDYKENLQEEVAEREGEIIAPAEWTSILLDLIQTQISFYIGRRILWTLGGILVLVIFLANSAHKAARNNSVHAYSDFYTGGF